MAAYHCPNLTIVEEHEVINNNKSLVGLSIIIKLPPVMDPSPTSEIIQQSIQKQSKILIPLDKISRFENNFVAVTNSLSETTTVLANPNLRIGTANLVLMPCTIDYGAITLPIDSALPYNTESVPKTLHSEPQQQILLKVQGLPPHLCSTFIVQRLFTNICVLADIEFNGCDSSFSAKTYASSSTIPPTAFIGIRACTNGNTILYIWPLWYDINTEEMRNPAARLLKQPANDPKRMERPIRYTLYEAENNTNGHKKTSGDQQLPISNQPGTSNTAQVPAKRARIIGESTNPAHTSTATTSEP